ncbi:MAG: carotenoid 1,2-hydratase [Caldithrix sp.]|nr:carotenoid 1,2-hydratase [Caldithrix sp.]
MTKRYWIGVALLITIVLTIGIVLESLQEEPIGREQQTVNRVLGNTDTAGYARAIQPRNFQFPYDHGPHPAFKTEWWYLTGNVTDVSGQRFGYQFTIFRTAMVPKPGTQNNTWLTNQVYMGHLAVSDISRERFYHFERFSRSNNQLAGARRIPLKVWLENWQLYTAQADTGGSIPPMHLRASNQTIGLDLHLQNSKPPVLQGDRGLSQKGPQPGNASYYYTLPRLTTRGTFTIHDETFKVEGLSWLDREWSTSALDTNQVGWDWFALQLDNGIDIMYYQIRQRGNRVDPHSKGSIVFADGDYELLSREQVRLEVLDHWQSPRGGGYPAEWNLRIPAHQTVLHIEPAMADQELDVSLRYWEGAVQIKGTYQEKAITGKGYVELTGYAEAP